jgi:NADPH:quinone reductase-like Zn-dependent oxidoreductase
MKAIVYDRYGSPDVLELREIDTPVAADDEVLVRVRACSVNPADWHTMTGTPYVARLQFGLRAPKTDRLGIDVAGVVEAVGKDVTRFRPGDEVFGGANGAFAEVVCIREDRAVVTKPANVTFEEAAAVPVAAITALQGLRDKGGLQPGHRVLVNGASGGVGTFAVQIAKALGAEAVTAVCSTRNVDLVRSIGADRVVDYTNEDFTKTDERYDLILDGVGNRSWPERRDLLTPRGTLVIVGGSKDNRVIGPLGDVLKVLLAAMRGSRKAVFFIAKLNKDDMEVLRSMLEAGTVRPVIDKRYTLSEISDALAYLGAGHAQGKIVVTV